MNNKEQLLRALESFILGGDSFSLSMYLVGDDTAVDIDYTSNLNIDDDTITLNNRIIDLNDMSEFQIENNPDNEITKVEIIIRDAVKYVLTNVDLMPY